MKSITDTTAIVNDLFDLYIKHGSQEYHGEPVSQLEHMLQCAQLALEEGSDDEMILAAFFHDIGHICETATPFNRLEELGIMSHEKIGADFLRVKGFPEKIACLVENHVKAKRYLTFKYPHYYSQLSEASKKTLEYQGGPMSLPEAIAFEHEPLFKEYLQLRKWDEQAKKPNIPLMDINLLKAKSLHLLENTFSRL
ncbi:MAG: HD domain-containing protein [Cyclobacteriaceae bacterium]|nr:HD domain-containing protein [Cyclobacteriaceae bacterium]